MEQAIIGYHTDDDLHWVAELACGHNQHVRHEPPWMNRIESERQSQLGHTLNCKKCDENAPRDF